MGKAGNIQLAYDVLNTSPGPVTEDDIRASTQRQLQMYIMLSAAQDIPNSVPATSGNKNSDPQSGANSSSSSNEKSKDKKG